MDDDLRHWLGQADAMSKLKRIEGADWDLEIGTATALNLRRKDCPALLFDNIKDYPTGYRVLTCTGSTASLVALTLNLPKTDSDSELVGILREKIPQWEANLDKFDPQAVNIGPVLENIISGDDVDLFKFPTPKWNLLDGGRFIGTGHAVITKDPDTEEVNLGTYRLQVLDKRTTGWYMDPNQHGNVHREKYHAKGERCPVAISIGHHPLIFRVACLRLPLGTEYQFAGAIKGEPIKVITEEITGLPIPADSEIVLAGWCPPGVYRTEGPFGEWTGYYGSGETQSLIIEVERIYHRNDPIIVGSPPGRPPSCDGIYYRLVYRSARLHHELIKSGVRDVKGVWLCPEVNGAPLIIVSIKQQYAGHARQAAYLASQSLQIGVQGRYVIVVDEDIDPTNMADVLWAVCTRSDPEKDIDIIRRAPSGPLDTMIRKPAEAFFNSRAIIDACKPYEWIDEFAKPVDLDPEVIKRVKRKWKDI